jgi:hypothetical protein
MNSTLETRAEPELAELGPTYESGAAGFTLNTVLTPAAAVCGLLLALGTSPSGVAWQARLVLGAGAALSQVGIQALSLELGALRGRFPQALALAAFAGSGAGAALLFAAKLLTHHRPLGAVSVAVVAIGSVLVLTALTWKLVSRAAISSALAWLPLALVGMLAAGVGRDAAVAAWSGVVIAVALKLFAHRMTARAVPRWVSVLVLSLMLGGNVVAWQTGVCGGSGEIGRVLGGACAWLSGPS